MRRAGCPQAPIPGVAEVTDSAAPEKAVCRCPNRSDFRTPAVKQLAKHLAAATIAYEMGISFDTAMCDYVGHGQVGELWKIAARFILTGQTGRSPNFFPEELDAFLHWSNRVN